MVSYQSESVSSKWELPFLPPSSLELWRKERAKRQLSFWWKTLILIGYHVIQCVLLCQNYQTLTCLYKNFGARQQALEVWDDFFVADNEVDGRVQVDVGRRGVTPSCLDEEAEGVGTRVPQGGLPIQAGPCVHCSVYKASTLQYRPGRNQLWSLIHSKKRSHFCS